MSKPEQHLHVRLCGWLSIQYPDLYFLSDPSGLRVTAGLRQLLMKTRSSHAQLDLILLQPCREFKALILELKSETPFKLNGELKTDKHLLDQSITMSLLESKGYKCNWVWDLTQGQNIIENYLGKSTVKDEPLFP